MLVSYSGAVRTSSMLEFSSRDGVNMILDEVQCTGLENSLYECTHSPWGDHNCRSYETAGVVCKPNKGRHFVICFHAFICFSYHVLNVCTNYH